MTLARSFHPTNKGHFCSLLVSNIFCDPLFLLSTLCYLFSTLSARKFYYILNRVSQCAFRRTPFAKGESMDVFSFRPPHDRFEAPSIFSVIHSKDRFKSGFDFHRIRTLTHSTFKSSFPVRPADRDFLSPSARESLPSRSDRPFLTFHWPVPPWFVTIS